MAVSLLQITHYCLLLYSIKYLNCPYYTCWWHGKRMCYALLVGYKLVSISTAGIGKKAPEKTKGSRDLAIIVLSINPSTSATGGSRLEREQVNVVGASGCNCFVTLGSHSGRLLWRSHCQVITCGDNTPR